MSYKLFRGFVNRKGEQCVVMGGSNGEGSGPDYNKADKVPGATAGNLAALNENGNLMDSGKKASDFAAAEHGHDGYAPTNHSHSIGDVTGLTNALAGKLSKQDDVFSIVAGRTYRYAWEDKDLAEETLGQILALSPTPNTPAVCVVDITETKNNNAVHRCMGIVEWTKGSTENNGHTTDTYFVTIHIGTTTKLTNKIYVYDDGFHGYSMDEFFTVTGEDLIFNIKSRLDSKMPCAPLEVSFQAGRTLDELLPANGEGQFTQLFISTAYRELRSVVAHVEKGANTYDVYGHFVNGQVGSTPTMKFYFGNYCFTFTTRDDAQYINNGDVDPEDVEWDLAGVSSIDNLLTF